MHQLIRGAIAPPASAADPVVSGSKGSPGHLVRDDRSVGRIGGGAFTLPDGVLDNARRPVGRADRREKPVVGLPLASAPALPRRLRPTDVAVLLCWGKISSGCRFGQSRWARGGRGLQRTAPVRPNTGPSGSGERQGSTSARWKVSVLSDIAEADGRNWTHEGVYRRRNRHGDGLLDTRSKGGTVSSSTGNGMWRSSEHRGHNAKRSRPRWRPARRSRAARLLASPGGSSTWDRSRVRPSP